MKSFIFITFAKFKLYDPNHTINMKINRHFVGFSLIVGLLLSSCQSKVDLIVHNANVYTLGQNNLKASRFIVYPWYSY